MKHTLGTFRADDCMRTAILEVLNSNWLSPGPKVELFEQEFSQLHNNKYGVMVNSGTDALRIALAAMKERYGWSDGDQVIVPSVTFVATINVIYQVKLEPFVVDVSMHDFNINPDNILRRYPEGESERKKIKMILPVHLAGRPADMPRLLEIARTYDLKVIEDSCEAVGIEGIAKGDITCFSFYMAHLLTTGVGGMAITNDPDLKYLMWSYANHGRRAPKTFVYDRIGYSCRPTEFEAAIGLCQLPKLPEIIAKHRDHYQILYQALERLPEFYICPPGESACMFFPILLQEDCPINKFDLMAHLTEHGIENRELMPLIDQPCYRGSLKGSYSVAEWINTKGFYIGCHQDLDRARLEETISVIRQFLSSAKGSRESQKACA